MTETARVTSFYSVFRDEVSKALVGQEPVIRLCAIALVASGHVLLEGVPGVGKTLLAKSIARVLRLDYRRVQFTPDLMPADIVGTSVYDLATREFRIRRGPIFANVFLADEINRAPAKVQAALLEAMEERGVTLEGSQQALPDPFLVLATQNPVEYEGTYHLPEAQQDRFLFKAVVGYPTPESELEVLDRWNRGIPLRDPEQAGVEPRLDAEAIATCRAQAAAVTADPGIRRYIVDIAAATRQAAEIALGASTRAEVMLLMAAKAAAVLDARDFITPDDVKELATPCLRHRIVLRPEAEVAGHTPDSVLGAVLARVTPPR